MSAPAEPAPAAAAGSGLDLLVFGAHPDDVELCCGGLLALSAAQGHRTGIVDLSRGELATSGTPEARALEAERSARLLGLTVRENLGFPDGFIHPFSGYDLEDAGERAARSQLAAAVAVLRRLRPALLVLPWAHERHPDHEAASALLTKAVFFAGVRRFPIPGARADDPASPASPVSPSLPPFTVPQVLYYPMRYELPPSFVVDVSAVAARKAEAIACYGSQIKPAGPTAPGQPPPLIASPLTLQAFEARDRYYGAMIGVQAGEPYLLRGVMGLRDPVGHFRAHPFPGALFYGRPQQ